MRLFLLDNDGIPFNKMKDFLKSQWFLVFLAIVLFMGYSCCDSAMWAYSHAGVAPLVVVQMFLMSFTLPTSDLIRGFRNFRSILIAFAVGFVWMPATAFAIAYFAFDPGNPYAIGLFIMAAMPTTMVSNIVWARMAKADDALSLAITIFMTGTCFLFTSALIALGAPLLAGTANTSALPFREIAGTLFSRLIVVLLLEVVLPAFIGQVVQKLSKLDTVKYKKPVGVFCQALVLLMVWMSIGKAHTDVMAKAGGAAMMAAGVILFILLLVNSVHILGMMAAWILTRLAKVPVFSAKAVIISSSEKTLPGGVIVLSAIGNMFSGLSMAIIPFVAFHACQLIFDTIVVSVWNAKDKKALNGSAAIEPLPAEIKSNV
jgi:solute carrier family 10 (sodium/bile acid cotransporter), member 7